MNALHEAQGKPQVPERDGRSVVPRDVTVSCPFPFDELFSITEIVIEGEAAAPAFAGTPGKANCDSKSVSALAKHYGGMPAAAVALGFGGVAELQNAIRAFCGGRQIDVRREERLRFGKE